MMQSAILWPICIGEEKKGDLAGVRVYKFPVRDQQFLLAYEFDTDNLSLLALGVHENFIGTSRKAVEAAVRGQGIRCVRLFEGQERGVRGEAILCYDAEAKMARSTVRSLSIECSSGFFLKLSAYEPSPLRGEGRGEGELHQWQKG